MKKNYSLDVSIRYWLYFMNQKITFDIFNFFLQPSYEPSS